MDVLYLTIIHDFKFLVRTIPHMGEGVDGRPEAPLNPPLRKVFKKA